ncbi:MAG: sulfatase-like hydrolase/transferase, partial [Candidatus Latescibacteria bacterium]|nr:sulfatase-like hydrolase/transferase [Candidatus Latescibacterota bacterium]
DTFDPHEPWDAPPRFQKMYRKKYPFERYIFGYGVKMEDIREDDIPILRDLYAAEVTYTDYCLGRFFDKVKSLGLWDNTVIVFSSDHGTHLGEDGCVQKQAKNLKSCLAKIPLIIRHPGDSNSRGRTIDAFTSHMDFMPTFLSLLGVNGYTGMDGQNMWDIVTGAKSKLRDYTVTGYGNYGAIHTDKWHFLRNYKGDDPGYGPALFDLADDRLEEQNVIGRHADVAADMEKIMAETFEVTMG